MTHTTSILLGAVIISVPLVMLAARIVGAGNTGFGSALLTVFLTWGLFMLTGSLFSGNGLVKIISGIAGIAIYAFTLDTTILRAFAASLIVAVMPMMIIVLFAGSAAILLH